MMSSRSDPTRRKILAAAWSLLTRHGGANVRMGDIAREVGISRQAVYLHFASRSELMIATVQFGDEELGASELVEPWRQAEGVDKLDAWIAFWGAYLPKIYGVAKALMLARESDEAAAAAWDDRMADVRRSCRKTIAAVESAGVLAESWDVKPASELLATMLSVAGYEELTRDRGWSAKRYTETMQLTARRTFVAGVAD